MSHKDLLEAALGYLLGLSIQHGYHQKVIEKNLLNFYVWLYCMIDTMPDKELKTCNYFITKSIYFAMKNEGGLKNNKILINLLNELLSRSRVLTLDMADYLKKIIDINEKYWILNEEEEIIFDRAASSIYHNLFDERKEIIINYILKNRLSNYCVDIDPEVARRLLKFIIAVLKQYQQPEQAAQVKATITST